MLRHTQSFLSSHRIRVSFYKLVNFYQVSDLGFLFAHIKQVMHLIACAEHVRPLITFWFNHQKIILSVSVITQ
jgi:hypothetical protein